MLFTKFGILLLTIPSCFAFAQVPPWVLQPPRGFAFAYATGSSGPQATPASALQAAEQMALQALMQKQGSALASSQSLAMRQGNLQGNYSRTLELRTDLKLDPMRIDKLDVIARTFYENENGYSAHVLLRTPSTSPKQGPSVWACAWRSAIVPGWGHSLHGGKMLPWTAPWATGLATGALSWRLSQVAFAEARSARTQERRNATESQAQALRGIALTGFGLAAVTWVWGLADVTALAYRDPEGLTHFGVQVDL